MKYRIRNELDSQVLTDDVIDKCIDSNGYTRHGHKRPFVNLPNYTCIEKGHANHIFIRNHSKNMANFSKITIFAQHEWERL